MLNLFRPKGRQKNKKAFEVSKQAQAFADTVRLFISLVFLGDTVTQKWDQWLWPIPHPILWKVIYHCLPALG